jgi:outer membrane murein-binding lipoprotein Lpp
MAMLAVVLAVALQPGQASAQAIDCNQVTRAVNTRGDAKGDAISRDEAATAEAVDAAKKCLANIARAINAISIPGVAFSVDFSGILSGMINRACQVVTTQIDSAGRVVSGTVSGSANRVIGDVNSAIGLPPGTGTPVSGTVGSVATPGFAGTPMGGTVALPPVTQPGLFDRMACTLRGNCP